MKNRLDISTHHYFPIQFTALGIGLIVMAFFAFEMYPFLSIGFIILGLLLATTHYRLLLDAKHKKYKEYLWILGFKKGSHFSYEQIHYVYLNRLRFNDEYGPFAVRFNASGKIFQGFIKLSNNESLFIGESIKKDNLLKKIRKISQAISVEIRDNV